MTKDTTEIAPERPNYKWIVLIINWVAVFFVYAAWTFILVAFADILPGAELEPQRYWIWTLPFIGLACMALPAGLIIDRYGLKKSGFLGLCIVIVSAFWRASSFDFFTLAASSILLGFGIGIILPIGNKLISLWFGAKEIGTASGITVMAAGFGIAVSQSLSATVLKPLLGSWPAVFYLYAICVLAVLVLWNFIKEKPSQSVKRSRVPLRESLSNVIRNKFVWILAGVNFVILAIFYTVLKAFDEKGLEDLAISLVSYAAIISNVLMPIISDRLKNRRYLLLMAFIVLVPSLAFVSFAEGIWIWILCFIIGFMVGTITPIILAIPIELKGVGHTYIAGATGMMTAVGKVGGLAIPMVYFSLTSGLGEFIGFFFLVILAIGAIFLIFPLPETAGKAREADAEPK